MENIFPLILVSMGILLASVSFTRVDADPLLPNTLTVEVDATSLKYGVCLTMLDANIRYAQSNLQAPPGGAPRGPVCW